MKLALSCGGKSLTSSTSLSSSPSFESASIHKDMVTALCWIPDTMEILACSDDKSISRWSCSGEYKGKLVTSLAAPVTEISFIPSLGKQVTDLFVIACADGTFRLYTKAGREEKIVNAHQGALTRIKWNMDGTALVSAGEEGDIKIWSRNGNLRSTLLSTGVPIYALAWGPDNDSVLASNGGKLLIKSIQQSQKKISTWKAHNGLVLCVDWNRVTNLIASGGEDCCYKIWDVYGRQLYSSSTSASATIGEHVINSIAWRPNGEQLVVGSFNSIRLCDQTGWVHSRERTKSTGTFFDVAWSPDGTQIAGACGGYGGAGTVLLGQIVNQTYEYGNITATVITPTCIRVEDVSANVDNISYDELKYRDRVVEMNLGYDHMIVCTTSQCHIYTTNNLNTPHIFDLKASVSLILVTEELFALVDNVTGIMIYNYDGKFLSNPKFQGYRPDGTSKNTISLTKDTLAIVDHTDATLIRLYDVYTGKPLIDGNRNMTENSFSRGGSIGNRKEKEIPGVIVHSTDVIEIGLSQFGNGLNERRLAFVDKNKECYLTPVVPILGYNSNLNACKYKLQTHVDSIRWHNQSDMLCALADGRLILWYYPNIVYVDKELLTLTKHSREASELGKFPKIGSFFGARVTVRRVDGAMITESIPQWPILLAELTTNKKWEESVKLCRYIKGNDSSMLWACLAGMSIHGHNLGTAEVALAALNYVDKLEFILYIMKIPSIEARNAELALYRRCFDEAERILLQATPPLLYRAIKMNIRLFRWTRALELAVNSKQHIDTVLAYRQMYLENTKRVEKDQRFLEYQEKVTIDWDAINARKQKERDEEVRTYGGQRGSISMQKGY